MCRMISRLPLTSIINYVDLLQKEDIDNEKVREYLDVLDRQSSRPKKLIQDLLEGFKGIYRQHKCRT